MTIKELERSGRSGVSERGAARPHESSTLQIIQMHSFFLAARLAVRK